MPIPGSKVGIIGGSIAGSSAAIALGHLGCEVHIFEPSSSALRDRGSGIAIPIALRDTLIAGGYLPPDYPSIVPSVRRWVVADGTAPGKELWVQASAAALSNWGVLWRSLRSRIGAAFYRGGTHVDAVKPTSSGAAVMFEDGGSEQFDVVLGADGYRSAVRASLFPDSAPIYAGYMLWRGNFPESELTDRTGIESLDGDNAWLTVCFDGGHGVMYPIPDFGDSTGPGRRRVNWAIYSAQPDGFDFTEPTSIPPGQVDQQTYTLLEQLLSAAFPPRYRPLVASIALIGDAGSVTRPHTGSGATKAMQDALTIERLGGEHSNWDDVLAAYDADRTANGTSVVALGRRIGRDQVERTPPWSTMTHADFEAWTAARLGGDDLYFCGDTVEDSADQAPAG
jgi:2-polyprenyl-6-methoxyphenol hydroxylase-like FAD-dependent oxidoreductase